MSRIGKMPIPVPAGVEVTIAEQEVKVKGPLGSLERTFHPLVRIEKDDQQITVSPVDDSQNARALWGLTRSLLNNMVVGVSAGFKKVMEISGVGWRAEAAGDVLKLSLGFSHPVEMTMPAGVSVSVEKNVIITLSCIDKELLGQTAATIRRYRPPEPYKGKGIKYAGEQIRRKVGKAGVK